MVQDKKIQTALGWDSKMILLIPPKWSKQLVVKERARKKGMGKFMAAQQQIGHAAVYSIMNHIKEQVNTDGTILFCYV